ncbi:prevent-host-death family protein [Variovorax boronicumulans]|uniref:Prevent-host-death family protein n=1 Tax=Variovorax boronicumulans TaxID=436515 RepID=A0AAW8DTF3_9BURK|nr:type II toxin-antitoxin system prevent-host-death family antitoxin [Variovorax boronicumulans]MDP9877558.1 prevent-host-death family protein [Variovorax boronicumulans]MDP9917462.1 prevent-host-death family protein [Variovorax boronicumulans]MDP9922843.1 prevent-host-death family protein [Variovorax boronicumulans]
MAAVLPNLNDLPRQNASHVKNRWGDVVRQVQQSGSVAVTNHSTVEMVLLTAATYNQLVEDAQALQAREQSVLDELARRFDARLGVLQQPDAAAKVGGLFAAKGKLERRPKAGDTF